MKNYTNSEWASFWIEKATKNMDYHNKEDAIRDLKKAIFFLKCKGNGDGLDFFDTYLN